MKVSKLLKDYPDVLKQWDYELNIDACGPLVADKYKITDKEIEIVFSMHCFDK